jgi:hypothetical protein
VGQFDVIQVAGELHGATWEAAAEPSHDGRAASSPVVKCDLRSGRGEHLCIGERCLALVSGRTGDGGEAPEITGQTVPSDGPE